MRTYQAALIAAAVVSALAACVNGGGSGTPAPGPSPNPSPAGSFRPAKNGDSFHYDGTLVETLFWRPAQPGPSNVIAGISITVPTSTPRIGRSDNLTTVATNCNLSWYGRFDRFRL